MYHLYEACSLLFSPPCLLTLVLTLHDLFRETSWQGWEVHKTISILFINNICCVGKNPFLKVEGWKYVIGRKFLKKPFFFFQNAVSGFVELSMAIIKITHSGLNKQKALRMNSSVRWHLCTWSLREDVIKRSLRRRTNYDSPVSSSILRLNQSNISYDNRSYHSKLFFYTNLYMAEI